MVLRQRFIRDSDSGLSYKETVPNAQTQLEQGTSTIDVFEPVNQKKDSESKHTDFDIVKHAKTESKQHNINNDHDDALEL